MTNIATSVRSRTTHDQANGALRTWFDPSFRADSKEGEAPEAVARRALADSAHLFKWKKSLADLKQERVIDAPNASSVRFSQLFAGLPVFASDIVVNVDDRGHLTSVYNAYHYDIPADLKPDRARIGEEEARRIAQAALPGHRGVEVLHGELVIYQYRHVPVTIDKPHGANGPRLQSIAAFALNRAEAAAAGRAPRVGQHFLAWNLRVQTGSPRGLWRVFVDVMTGDVLNIIDLNQYDSGTAFVFDPNPIVTSGNVALRHSSPAATINAERRTVSVDRLDPPSGGVSKLHGSFVRMAAEESPAVAEPTSATATFEYAWDDNSFLDAMAYFHLDRFQNYVQSTLGITNAANYAIPVDPQGFNGDDNSHYQPAGDGTGYIAFGGGTQPIPGSNPVPDAADAMVVLHEYGHAIQDNSNPNFDNPASGLGEGFGDALAAIFYDDRHADPAATRGFMMSWDSEMGTGSWSGRRYDMAWLFDGPEYAAAMASDNHTAGQLWCATMFELYRKLGGDSSNANVKAAARDIVLRLHLQANFLVPTNDATAQQMGQQIEAADQNLGGWRYPNGLHRKVIYDTFRRRHMAGYPPLSTDVYINDGRQGGYGSLSGNDNFTEKQWLDVWWETQDVWVRVTPYADAAAQQAGDPGDHQEPPVGSTAYLYVRVGNKGTAASSGPVTVKAFHADPGIGLTWPEDWIPMDTPSITVPNVAPGVANHVVVGPFPWTPTVVGHECVLAVVECANDHAVTQDLGAGDHVYDGDMVPFDNNIAQRNLNPTSSKTGGKYKFVVRNPFETAHAVELAVTSSLPKGWHWSLPDRRIELGPNERRWVEIAIERGEGEEVTRFDTPHLVQVTGLIDGRPIGGISFYIAPPSAFPGAHGQPHEGGEVCAIEGSCEDLVKLDIPWRDCDIEGEMDLRLRFKRRHH
jgi:hypothetical protein